MFAMKLRPEFNPQNISPRTKTKRHGGVCLQSQCCEGGNLWIFRALTSKLQANERYCFKKNGRQQLKNNT